MSLTPADLRDLRAAGRFDRLWQAALPVAAAALRRLVRRGRLGAFDEDLAQTVYLAMGGAVRRWDPEQAGFTTFVTVTAGGVAQDAQKAHRRGGFTGVPDGERPATVSLDQPLHEDDLTNGHELLAYPIPPRGFRPPDQELEVEQQTAELRVAIAGLTDTERAVLRQAFGGTAVVPLRTAERWKGRTVRKLQEEVADG